MSSLGGVWEARKEDVRRRVEKCFRSGAGVALGSVEPVIAVHDLDGCAAEATSAFAAEAACSSSKVHGPPVGCSRSIRALSPSFWNKILFLTSSRAKSHVFALPGGGSLVINGQMKRGHSLVQVDRKTERDVDAVGPMRES